MRRALTFVVRAPSASAVRPDMAGRSEANSSVPSPTGSPSHTAAEADRVIVLDDGKILLEGTPQEVFTQRDVLRSVGLDVPQSIDLSEAMKSIGFPLDGDVTTPKKCAEAIKRALDKKKEAQKV